MVGLAVRGRHERFHQSEYKGAASVKALLIYQDLSGAKTHHVTGPQ